MIKSRILISMFQVLTGIATTFNIPYPEFYTNILRYLAAFELDLFSAAPIGCIVNITFHEIFLARTIIPLVAIVFLKLVPVIGARMKNIGKEAFDGFETAAFFVMFLVYPSCSQYVFAMFQCVEVDDGTSWLRRDFSIDCASPKHIIMSWVAWVMFVVYPLGIPAYFAYTMLWQHGAGLDELQRLETRARAHAMLRKSQKSAVGVQDNAVKKLQLRFRATMAKRKKETLAAKRKEREAEKKPELKRQDAVEYVEPESKKRWRKLVTEEAIARHRRSALERSNELATKMYKGVTDEKIVREYGRKGQMGVTLPASVLKMTAGYEFRVYWFEIIECYRKLALTGMPVWFEMGSVAQLTFGLLISFFSFGAYMVFQPYAKDGDDRLSQLCQAQTFFALLSSIILEHAMREEGENGPTSRGMGYIISFLTGVPIVTAFLIELYGDDGKRKKEKMALKFINKYILTPIRRWLMKRRASIERERIKKDAWRLNSAREYEERSERRSSERRSSLQGSLVDYVREESSKRPRRLYSQPPARSA